MNEVTVLQQPGYTYMGGIASRLQFASRNHASPCGNPKSGPEAWCDGRILPSSDRLAPDLSDVIPQALFDISGFVKA
jgi:hypothetical protein